MSAGYSKHRDYFVRLYTLNHPVGFLSRADGSRSRIKACGLLRASIMTQSAIHLAPTLYTQPPGKKRSTFLSSFPVSFSLALPSSFSFFLVPILYVPFAFPAKPRTIQPDSRRIAAFPRRSLSIFLFSIHSLPPFVLFEPPRFLSSSLFPEIRFVSPR